MSEEQINIKLVQAVEKFPVIYDYSLPGHSNKDEGDKAWREVSKELNLNVSSCKDKWRNCRNCWARYLRQTPARGFAARNKKPYYLAEYLVFLTPFTKSRRRLGTLETRPTTEEPPPTVEERRLSPATVEEHSDRDSTNKGMRPLPLPHRNRNKRELSKTDIDQVFTSYLETKSKKRAGGESDNPDLCFLKSLLPDIAKLAPAQKSSFKLFVQQKLHEMLYSSPADFQCAINMNQSRPSTSVYQNLNVNQSGSSSSNCTSLPSPCNETVAEIFGK